MSIAGGNLSLTNDALVIHSVDYVAFMRLSEIFHFLGSPDCWLTEIVFEQRLSSRVGSKLFVNWHCIDIFGAPTR